MPETCERDRGLRQSHTKANPARPSSMWNALETTHLVPSLARMLRVEMMSTTIVTILATEPSLTTTCGGLGEAAAELFEASVGDDASAEAVEDMTAKPQGDG